MANATLRQEALAGILEEFLIFILSHSRSLSIALNSAHLFHDNILLAAQEFAIPTI